MDSFFADEFVDQENCGTFLEVEPDLSGTSYDDDEYDEERIIRMTLLPSKSHRLDTILEEPHLQQQQQPSSCPGSCCAASLLSTAALSVVLLNALILALTLGFLAMLVTRGVSSLAPLGLSRKEKYS